MFTAKFECFGFAMPAILKISCCEDASLEYTGVNKHSEDKRIGLMDSTIPVEALLAVKNNRTVASPVKSLIIAINLKTNQDNS